MLTAIFGPADQDWDDRPAPDRPRPAKTVFEQRPAGDLTPNIFDNVITGPQNASRARH